MEDKIIITMLGEFSISYKNKKITNEDNRSKKIWRLLEYLITFHQKEIPQSELIDMLWPNEDISNPVNALKTSLHRVRNLLKQLDLPEDCSPILQSQGSYRWNKDLNYCIDIELFDHLCGKGNEQSLSNEEKLVYNLEALAYYRGDYLPNSNLDSWTTPINTYYHSIYLKVVTRTIELLEHCNEYNTITGICLKAIKLDPYEEILYYYLILAYSKLGQKQLAINQYDYVTDLFYNKFAINPSDQLGRLYKEIVKSNNDIEIDLAQIRELLKEPENTDYAYCCDFSIFKEIYRIEARSAVRSGNSIFLCLLTIYNSGSNKPLKQSMLNISMVRLKSSIQNCLRRGDVFARYSTAQYILMLPTTSYENGERVMERILKQYRQEKPRIAVTVGYKLLPLEPCIINE